MNKRGEKVIALSEISILIFSIIAFGFIISNANLVSAQNYPFTGTTSFPTKAKQFAIGTDTVGSSPYGLGGSQGMSEWWSGYGYGVQGILQSAIWAGTAYLAVVMIGGLFGLDDAKTKSIAAATSAGFGLGRGAFTFAESTWAPDILSKFPGGATGFGWTMGIMSAAIVFYMTYKDTDEEKIQYTCESWQAPTGGKYCEECNKQSILPCSEYQCRSLGQACQIVNVGTVEEKCVWVNPKDVNFPTIEPWINALMSGYRYTPDNTISPPDRGVKIENMNTTNKCVAAFTPLTFGITTNEPAQCKIDYLRKQKFAEMEFWFGGSQLFRQNHTQILSLPGKAAYEAENIEINNNGNYELFVKCQDANANYNTASFVFKFCVDEGPDTTAPAIITTSLINGMPISNNKSSVDITVYVNEPSECKWSHQDEDYKDMDTTMTCSSSVIEMNAQMLYECKTTLTSLKNNEENKFYFKCKDRPKAVESSRNTNTDSYIFTLKGTIPLVLNKAGPNGTVKDATDPVKVTLTAETSAGAEEGKSTCYYNEEDSEDDKYIEFRNTNSHKHSQDLYLATGSYTYYIKCVDLGGNTDKKTVNFKVESDSEAPTVVRAYHEETSLKIVTNEESTCVYDPLNCNYLFEDGLPFTTLNGINHFTEWDTTKNFYVKCKDKYGKQPTGCSIIVRPFEIYKSV